MLGINEIKEKISPVLMKYNVTKAGIFGSYSKQTATASSDVDILVELGAFVSLLDFVTIQLELEDVLGNKVDLVEYQAIKPALRQQILQEEIRIYG